MIVISDTTPIISLLKINQLELLNDLFGEVQIPDAVYKELISKTKYYRQMILSSALKFCDIAEGISATDFMDS